MYVSENMGEGLFAYGAEEFEGEAPAPQGQCLSCPMIRRATCRSNSISLGFLSPDNGPYDLQNHLQFFGVGFLKQRLNPLLQVSRAFNKMFVLEKVFQFDT